MERRWAFGGVAGNEILTSLVAAVLTVLLMVEGITILQLGPLLVPHMVVGLMLIPVVGLKLGATGYRFVRYYTHAPSYREKGPPLLPLRLLAPILVAATIGVFATGVALLVEGRKSDTLLLLHKGDLRRLGSRLRHPLPRLPSARPALPARRLERQAPPRGRRRRHPGKPGRRRLRQRPAPGAGAAAGDRRLAGRRRRCLRPGAFPTTGWKKRPRGLTADDAMFRARWRWEAPSKRCWVH
jgi:hypothetical protein